MEDLKSEVQFLLNAFETDGCHCESLRNNQNLSKNGRSQVKTEESPFIIERLEEVERILTDAPEGNSPSPNVHF